MKKKEKIMPLDTTHPRLETWEAFFATLPYVHADQSTGKRQFWSRYDHALLDATAACETGQHDGLERGSAWAEQTIDALQNSEKRGVLLRILRDMEFESAEAIGFINALEDSLARPSSPAV
jgi:hypothetical protein